jgi:hypothetical protein
MEEPYEPVTIFVAVMDVVVDLQARVDGVEAILSGRLARLDLDGALPVPGGDCRRVKTAREASGQREEKRAVARFRWRVGNGGLRWLAATYLRWPYWPAATLSGWLVAAKGVGKEA